VRLTRKEGEDSDKIRNEEGDVQLISQKYKESSEMTMNSYVPTNQTTWKKWIDFDYPPAKTES